MKNQIEVLAAFVDDHRYSWWSNEESICIAIPWRHATTGELGTDVVECTTASEVRAALGY